MKSLTYFLVLFFTVIICFIASFDKRIRFDKHFLSFLKASTLVAIPFIAWDIWFTALGVWWFNTDYTTGLVFAGLPIEEWLFFIFIPFSCIFTYFCIDKFFKLNWLDGFNNIIVFISVIVCVVIGLLHMDKMYTMLTALITTISLIYFHFIARTLWISRASFVFMILMLGFLPVNGVLTGSGLENPIVNYNSEEFMGTRILTIPIEDAVYGYTQFLWVLFFFKYFSKADIRKTSLSAELH